MGKSLASANFRNIAKIISSDRIKNTPKQLKFNSNNNNNVNLKRNERVDSGKVGGVKVEKSGLTRYPLAVVVSNCVKRWFNDTLKEANDGDTHMQILVGQMGVLGFLEHQKLGLLLGKLAVNSQDTMQVTLIRRI